MSISDVERIIGRPLSQSWWQSRGPWHLSDNPWVEAGFKVSFTHVPKGCLRFYKAELADPRLKRLRLPIIYRWDLLLAYLASRGEDRVVLGREEIERIMGPLPRAIRVDLTRMVKVRPFRASARFFVSTRGLPPGQVAFLRSLPSEVSEKRGKQRVQGTLWAPLVYHLQSVLDENASLVLTYEEIEAIRGTPLPPNMKTKRQNGFWSGEGAPWYHYGIRASFAGLPLGQVRFYRHSPEMGHDPFRQSHWDPIVARLSTVEEDGVRFSMIEIETLFGGQLPKSAYQAKFWSDPTRPWAKKGWRGRARKIAPGQGEVAFERLGHPDTWIPVMLEGWSKLVAHLQNSGQDEVLLSFEELEAFYGRPFTRSMRFPSYWTRPGRSWEKAGYPAMHDPQMRKNGQVRFRRAEGGSPD